LPFIGFFLGPILISVGIFIQVLVWKILLIVIGSILLLNLYFIRKPNSKPSKNTCSVCNGSGSIKQSAFSEHSVKNCQSYRTVAKICGMCNGTGLVAPEKSENE
jgi:hypothetical protein